MTKVGSQGKDDSVQHYNTPPPTYVLSLGRLVEKICV